ncbi:MAG TPA: hypothetical protein VHL11_09670 [Phototrophicaceae bacterium]|nr:hypothetical protein [Phototrophicaceae bacterium]
MGATGITAQATPEPESEKAILIISDQDGERKLYTVRTDGSGPQLFLDLTAYGRLISAALSPDGSKLAFVAFQDEDLFNLLYVLEISTEAATQVRVGLTDIADLTWTPDSSHLIYMADGVNEDFNNIYQYDPRTGMEQKLDWRGSLYQAVKFDFIGNMEQSPDGQKFVFDLHTLPPEAYVFFAVINADGTDAYQLPLTRPSYRPFAWNDQSDTIYFQCVSETTSEVNEICSMDLATQQTQIAISQKQIPEMTENGIREISIDHNRLAINFLLGSAIYVVDLQTGDITRLLEAEAYEISMIGWIDIKDK